MTREEAINYLHECSEAIGDTEHHTLSYAKEALNMAIKALSQQTEDAISRRAAIEKIHWLGIDNDTAIKCDLAIRALPSVNPQEPSDISNDGTLTVNVEDGRKISRVLVCGANHWGGLYYPDEQEPKTGQFAKWVATEIFDDMWEYNKDAFAEIACRKLAKLGIVRANGDKWELVEPQESEVQA